MINLKKNSVGSKSDKLILLKAYAIKIRISFVANEQVLNDKNL